MPAGPFPYIFGDYLCSEHILLWSLWLRLRMGTCQTAAQSSLLLPEHYPSPIIPIHSVYKWHQVHATQPSVVSRMSVYEPLWATQWASPRIVESNLRQLSLLVFGRESRKGSNSMHILLDGAADAQECQGSEAGILWISLHWAGQHSSPPVAITQLQNPIRYLTSFHGIPLVVWAVLLSCFTQ